MQMLLSAAETEISSQNFDEPDLIDWLRTDIRYLVALATASSDASAPTIQRDLATVAHDIKGLAATYGFPVLSRVCRTLEELATEASRHPHRLELIRLHALACQALVNEGYTGLTGNPMLSAVLVGLGNARIALEDGILPAR